MIEMCWQEENGLYESVIINSESMAKKIANNLELKFEEYVCASTSRNPEWNNKDISLETHLDKLMNGEEE